ncbi:MAG: hypothetical protein GW911_29235 [Armatimonadetes bacterium]|nr:hypothetical protein [Armatimonadota bacterium]NCO94964.1 hypothetical protein [Armatimonadota bacterium]NCP34527.1 hypothetical protein [Armatimonadota bacterium]NCQ31861.1 hypothetical protein [Armatimonadota bacterium]NDK16130.1 hypothetical protein [Armatimonadota bacterium]
MRQRTRFACVTFAWALTSALGPLQGASAMEALPDHRLTATTVGTYPDCEIVQGQLCVGDDPEMCWMQIWGDYKWCMETCTYQKYDCQDNCPRSSCDENPNDCAPCRDIRDLGPLPPSGRCQEKCDANDCNLFEFYYAECGWSLTQCF